MSTGAGVRDGDVDALFPFRVGVPEEDGGGGTDSVGRGPDTANRLLLHGARHHERDAVFLHWGQGRQGWGWQPTPDWRADRGTIRAALVLSQRAGLGAGQRVALWLPPGPTAAMLERAVWSIGAISVPVWPEWPLERVAEVVLETAPGALFAPSLEVARKLAAVGGRPDALHTVVCLEAPEEAGDDWISFAGFMDYGGVLDTPERASMWRTSASRIPSGTTASLDYGPPAGRSGDERPREVDHAEIVERASRLARRLPVPARARGTRVVATTRPDPAVRVLVVAGWADGLTRTVFAGSEMARDRLAELEPDLVVVDEEAGGWTPADEGTDVRSVVELWMLSSRSGEEEHEREDRRPT